MAHSICLIDDSIPLGDAKLFIDDTGRLNSSNIELLLNEEEDKWEEPVKELLENLINDKDSWSVSAFRNPDIYLNNFDKESYLPDFIIFDWDYGKMSAPTEELLKEILQKSFTLVAIYTRSDEKETVERIIKEEFNDYNNRINLIIKSEKNSPKKLIEWAEALSKNNFAYKFSKELRIYNRESMENLLVEFGKPDIKDFIWLFGSEDKESNKILLNAKDVSEMIVDKLRAELISKNFGDELPIIDANYTPTCSEEIVKKMWSLRLYYKPNDGLVRKGDIVDYEGKENIKYLVVSSDCHLKTFWKKNFGHLTVIPIYKVCKENKELVRKLKLAASEGEIKKMRATSLVNVSSSIEGPTILPCIPIGDSFYDYILFPKEISSIEVALPEEKKGNPRIVPLDYSHLTVVRGVDRISISEPFITPLVEHILYNISGYGVQDFPKGLQNSTTKNISEIF